MSPNSGGVSCDNSGVKSMRPKLKLQEQPFGRASVADSTEQISSELDRKIPDHFSPKPNNNYNPFTFRTAVTDKIIDISSQLRVDGPSDLQVGNNAKTQESIRIARLEPLVKQPIASLSDALLTPLATLGCVSGRIRDATRASRIAQSSTRPKLDADELVVKCAYCNASVPLAEVIARVTHSGSAQRTMELLAALAEEHAVECRGRKGPSLVQEDDVQFGVSEASSGLAAYYITSKG